MTAAAQLEVLYECGCKGLEVGQSFSHGLLVCPLHGEPVAPFERTPAPLRYRLTVVCDLEVDSLEAAERIAGRIESELVTDPRVDNYVRSLEERRPLS